jgi:hypothetical protein
MTGPQQPTLPAMIEAHIVTVESSEALSGADFGEWI